MRSLHCTRATAADVCRLQWAAIHALVEERRDAMVVVATGYGKSLCYQFPAVHLGGVALVVSPLISLMEDQVLSLRFARCPPLHGPLSFRSARGIAACILGDAERSRTSVDEAMRAGCSVVYTTPEMLADSRDQLLRLPSAPCTAMPLLMDPQTCGSLPLTRRTASARGATTSARLALPPVRLTRTCCQAYRELRGLRDAFPGVPAIALTATATEHVVRDIQAALQLRDARIVRSTFDRPNLFLAATPRSNSRLEDLRPFLVAAAGAPEVSCRLRASCTQQWQRFCLAGPTIVYAQTRSLVEDLAALLTSLGVAAGVYHAKRTEAERRAVHLAFLRNELQCIVATGAARAAFTAAPKHSSRVRHGRRQARRAAGAPLWRPAGTLHRPPLARLERAGHGELLPGDRAGGPGRVRMPAGAAFA